MKPSALGPANNCCLRMEVQQPAEHRRDWTGAGGFGLACESSSEVGTKLHAPVATLCLQAGAATPPPHLPTRTIGPLVPIP